MPPDQCATLCVLHCCEARHAKFMPYGLEVHQVGCIAKPGHSGRTMAIYSGRSASPKYYPTVAGVCRPSWAYAIPVGRGRGAADQLLVKQASELHLPTPGGPSLLSCNRPSLDQAHGHDDGWKPASSGRPSTCDTMNATTAAPMYPGVVRPALRHWLEKARTARPCSRCAPAHISNETNPAAGTGSEPASSKAARHPGGHPAPCADLPGHTPSISRARRALMGIHGK